MKFLKNILTTIKNSELVKTLLGKSSQYSPNARRIYFLYKQYPSLFVNKLIKFNSYNKSDAKFLPYENYILDTANNYNYVIGQMPRQSHKTTLCTLSALHYAIFNPNVKVSLVSYRQQETHNFRDYLIQLPDWLIDFNDTKISSDSITLPNSSTIQLFGAKSIPDKFKGCYFNYVIIDDATYISDILIETCLTSKTKTLILSSYRGAPDWFTRIFTLFH
jgi:hypothetical protein